ncbi:MAG: hypothetical protein LIO79_09285 [Rikenellaceae bacterium]|nr:hypothetical protein [Rikenellaceae bacterium]
MKQIKLARGIRNKILYGFIILGCLLFFSGMISFFELLRLSASTKVILENSRTDIEISDRMLSAVNVYDALMHQILNEKEIPDSLVLMSKDHLDSVFYEAFERFGPSGRMDQIMFAKNGYEIVSDEVLNDTIFNDIDWINDIYKTTYYDLTLAIKNFMLSTQDSVDNNTLILQSNAYRAIMPGIITLGIAIIIIIVFFGLIDLYYIKPVIKITKGLEGYIKNRIPFKPKIEGTDEIRDLRTYIEELISNGEKRD